MLNLAIVFPNSPRNNVFILIEINVKHLSYDNVDSNLKTVLNEKCHKNRMKNLNLSYLPVRSVCWQEELGGVSTFLLLRAK